ncbi:peptidylprolyl isomerase [Enterocloster clostridioformis]|uniref:peptidylprolyl isomerase n=1 Tax=Enterocloster clostridioformis TaxID=1531 RepID=UPI001F399298|nr:peptidylprolyl isomerase [Enterocloster clostridioformis]
MMAEQFMSNADLLSEVNKAIQKICIGGQSYQIGTKRLTRADLTQLYKMRNDLTAALQVEESTGLMENTMVAYFDRR